MNKVRIKKTVAFLSVLLTAIITLTGCFHAVPFTLDKTTLEMTVGESETLSAGDAVKVNWTSSDDKIASVKAGTVSAKSAGTAIITASLENGEQATCTVTVNDKLITDITLSSANTRLEVGKTIQLTASYSPSDATKTALSWESGNENVAMVNNDGFVVGIAEGVTMITCKSENGIEASCAVTVSAVTSAPISAPTLPPATEKDSQKATESNSQKNHQQDFFSSSSGGFIFPDSSTRYLTDSEIAATLKQQSGTPVADSFAQDAINEIYARNGYVFKTDSIRAYYEAQSWYRANPNFNGSFNSVEQYNINLLNKY